MKHRPAIQLDSLSELIKEIVVQNNEYEESPALVEGIIAHDKRMIARYPIVRLNGLRVQLCPTPPPLNKKTKVMPSWEKVVL